MKNIKKKLLCCTVWLYKLCIKRSRKTPNTSQQSDGEKKKQRSEAKGEAEISLCCSTVGQFKSVYLLTHLVSSSSSVHTLFQLSLTASQQLHLRAEPLPANSPPMYRHVSALLFLPGAACRHVPGRSGRMTRTASQDFLVTSWGEARCSVTSDTGPLLFTVSLSAPVLSSSSSAMVWPRFDLQEVKAAEATSSWHCEWGRETEWASCDFMHVQALMHLKFAWKSFWIKGALCSYGEEMRKIFT